MVCVYIYKASSVLTFKANFGWAGISHLCKEATTRSHTSQKFNSVCICVYVAYGYGNLRKIPVFQETNVFSASYTSDTVVAHRDWAYSEEREVSSSHHQVIYIYMGEGCLSVAGRDG